MSFVREIHAMISPVRIKAENIDPPHSQDSVADRSRARADLRSVPD